MSKMLRIHALHLPKLRALLGSGEEAFCAKVLRRIPEPAERMGLVKEWKRGVTGLILGDAGEALSARLPFETRPLTRATPALSLALASVVQGFSQEGFGGTVPETPTLGKDLIRRPLFGLEPDGTVVGWGGLAKDQVKELAHDPLFAPIWANGLDVISLSGSIVTD